jgi:hypothetical protein
MEAAKRPASTGHNYLLRDQLITKEDLLYFKQDLLAELKQFLKPSAEPQKKWLKSEEVKEILKVSPGTLQTLRINRTLQYTKIGGIIYYDYEHIQKIMAENLRQAK